MFNVNEVLRQPIRRQKIAKSCKGQCLRQRAYIGIGKKADKDSILVEGTVDSLIHTPRFLFFRASLQRLYIFLNKRVEEKKRIKSKNCSYPCAMPHSGKSIPPVDSDIGYLYAIIIFTEFRQNPQSEFPSNPPINLCGCSGSCASCIYNICM